MPNPANVRIAAGDSTCVLTYALSTDPAPVTASVPTSDPSLATLTFIVTNDTGGDLDLASVVFSIPVGPDAASLSPGSAGIGATSIDTRWQVNSPSTPVTGGLAPFTLAPKSGATLPVPNGSAIVVIFEVPVNQLTGTATIDIAEHIDPAPGFTSFEITKYPPGFFFDGLIVNIPSGTDLQPVAQVPYGTAVTLSWNVSVVPLSAIDIYYSSNAGQQPPSPPPQINPSALNNWTSPALVNDTIFTVVVTTSVAGGGQVTAALSAAVRVQQPDIAVNHIDAQSLAVAGASTLGNTIVGTLGASGAANLAAATMASAVVTGALAAQGAATLSGGLTAQGGAVSLLCTAAGLSGGSYSAATDGVLVGYVGQSSNWNSLCVAWMWLANSDGINVGCTGGNQGAFSGGWQQFQTSNTGTATIPVRRGTNFYVSVQQFGSNETQAPTAAWWIPLGISTGGASFKRISDRVPRQFRAGPMGGPKPPGPRRDKQIDALVAAVEGLFPEPLPARKRERLDRALRALTTGSGSG